MTYFYLNAQAAGVLAQIERGNKKKQGIEVIITSMIKAWFKKQSLCSLIYLCHVHVLQWDKEEEEKFKAKVVEAYEREGNSYYSTARLWDDGIIDPADTRKVIGLSISASMNRDPEETKYGVFRM